MSLLRRVGKVLLVSLGLIVVSPITVVPVYFLLQWMFPFPSIFICYLAGKAPTQSCMESFFAFLVLAPVVAVGGYLFMVARHRA